MDLFNSTQKGAQMTYRFDTRNVALSATKIQISRKDMNWNNSFLKHNRFEHEKIDDTPVLSLYLDVPHEAVDTISDYVDDFWTKPSPARVGNIKLTNAQLYEYQLRKAMDEAIDKVHEEWHSRLEKRVTKMLAQKELA